MTFSFGIKSSTDNLFYWILHICTAFNWIVILIPGAGWLRRQSKNSSIVSCLSNWKYCVSLGSWIQKNSHSWNVIWICFYLNRHCRNVFKYFKVHQSNRTVHDELGICIEKKLVLQFVDENQQCMRNPHNLRIFLIAANIFFSILIMFLRKKRQITIYFYSKTLHRREEIKITQNNIAAFFQILRQFTLDSRIFWDLFARALFVRRLAVIPDSIVW